MTARNRDLRWKIPLILAVVAVCAFQIYPPQDRIKLGLDLRGGIHLVMRVDVDEAVAAELRDDLDGFQRLLEEEGVAVVSGQVRDDEAFVVTLESPADRQQALDLAAEYFGAYDARAADAERPAVVMSMTANELSESEDRAVRQALQTIRNRIDEFGVAEPVIQRQGLSGERILVQLPGVEDPERVKSLLKTTALLELKLVESGPAPTREELLAPHDGELPPGTEVVEQSAEARSRRGETVPGGARFYLVQADPEVTGRDLKTARVSRDEFNLPAVSFTLNAQGAQKFGRATSENIGRQLAIILDENLYSAPVIEGRISDQGIIRGDFTLEEAEDLALVLRAGALPASIQYLEERTVGPSLGRESIQRGVVSALVGLALVVAFMLVYYKGAGVNAVVALALNLVLVLGVMASLGAALTLPGVAGFILIIGMAVDANVIIFERIREELDLGKTVRSAIDAGFSKAFSAIVDANVTTLVAAVFLFQFGTGPVKGFAVTLSIGIVASMFTAIFVSRVLFQLWTRGRAERLSI